jgi:hypothetical protein
MQKEGQNLIITTMTAFGIKLMLYLVLILVFYLLSKIQGARFAITFFVIYLSFTYYLLKVFIQTMRTKKNGE